MLKTQFNSNTFILLNVFFTIADLIPLLAECLFPSCPKKKSRIAYSEIEVYGGPTV
jgi:hypothetical protein